MDESLPLRQRSTPPAPDRIRIRGRRVESRPSDSEDSNTFCIGIELKSLKGNPHLQKVETAGSVPDFGGFRGP